MIGLIVFSVSIFGAAWGIGHAELSYPIRAWVAGVDQKRVRFARSRAVIVAGLECFGCISFHLGWLAFLSGSAPEGVFRHWWEAAIFSSGISLLLARAAGLLDSAPLKGGADDRTGEADDPPEGDRQRP